MPPMAGFDVAPGAVRDALAGRLRGDLLTDRFNRTAYATAACIYKIMPLAVVVPRDADDVAATVRAAADLGVSVIPRGAGSGLCGQALGRGIVLDFTKYMNRVLALDVDGRTVAVQPGLVTGVLNTTLAPHGFMLGPDPSSEPFCTLGGNLGNNSSGSRGIRYGSMKDHVRWLDVVLADGSQVRLEPVPLGGPALAALESHAGALGPIAAATRRLLTARADLVDRYRPRVRKNSAGYNLFDVLRDGTFDLTRLVVGSEGTLAVVTAAGLNVVPRPRERASVLFWFSDLSSAGRAVRPILDLGPSACEIMERHFLDIVRADGSVPAAYLPKEADTVLLVEFLADDRAANEASIAAVRRLILDDLRLAFGAIDAYDPAEQERLWIVRKRAVQILQRLPGPRRITPFIEDVVVPPDRLVDYIEGLRLLFDRHGVEAAIYGHAGDSNLHARPILDTRRPEDVVRMKAIAGDVARLTVDLGGTVSCEHGDGLTRSGYLALQFGDLYDVMREVKRLWDPAGTLNPGKIVTDAREIHLDDLRAPPGREPHATGAAFDRAPWAAELNRCHGCGTCRAYCPVYKVTRDETATPRAKANLLRAFVAGDLNAADLGDPHLRRIAALCYNCKTCLVECPSHVNVPGLVLRHKEYLGRGSGLSWRDRLMLRVRLLGRLGSLASPVSNWLLGCRTVRRFMAAFGGIAPDAAMPRFARAPLPTGIARAAAVPAETPNPKAEDSSAPRVAYFAGCFERFNDSRTGRAAVQVLEALGCDVLVPEEHCCGLPRISAGDAAGALADLRYNLDRLTPLVEDGYTITSGCPSCVLALREDYVDLTGNDCHAALVAAATRDLHDLLEALFARQGGQTFACSNRGPADAVAAPSAGASGRVPQAACPPVLRGDFWRGKRLAYHAPCHLRAAGRGDQPQRLLEKVLGIEFVVSNATCCGMGGTFGLKAAHRDLSRAIAQETFDRIMAAKPDAVVTPCGMCRTQLAAGTGLPAYSPAELLAAALTPPEA